MTGLVLLGLRILAAVALYAFLGWVLLFLWLSFKQEAIFIASRQANPLDLVINSPESQEIILHFKQIDITIGRDPNCDCVLAHSTVSARHARLAFHHNQWWVEDLISTNGTKINEEPLLVPTVVVNGDTITCGQITITVLFTSENNNGLGA